MAPGLPAADTAELVIRNNEWIRYLALGQAPVVIGRADECDLKLADPRVSRRHCRIAPLAEGGWQLEDLGSQSGTLLGGKPIQAPVRMRPGELVEVGSMSLKLELRPASTILSGNPTRDSRNVALLLRTVDELYASGKLEVVLRTIVDRAIQLAGADRGAILLCGQDQRLEAVAARSADGQDLAADEVLTHSLPGQVLQSGRPALLTDVVDSGEDVPQSVLQADLRSVLCAPLPGEEGPVGVLYADGRRPAEAFGPSELAVFEALAVHGALAIERARLREEQARLTEQRCRALEDEVEALRVQLGTEAPIGESPAMRSALDLLRRVAPSEATVLLTGETGTGKEVLARYLHRLSPHAKGPFVVVDCGAIPEGLIESELFGHEKGSFTGAVSTSEGRFREAEGGTVFLDEIGELPLLLQTRLLRVLQEKTVQAVGGKGRISVDVRVVCATHRDLGKLVAEGRFRQDLYYRISVLTVPIPALRDRGRDILLLAQHFLGRFTAGSGTSFTGFTREASESLLSHPWPGNVRELENRVHRVVLLAQPPYVTTADLGFGETGTTGVAPAEAELELLPLQQARLTATARFERGYLEEALRRTGGNVTQASELAQVTRSLFHRMMREQGINRVRFMKAGAEPGEMP